MSKIYEVAIIGGGVSGSVTALQLAKYDIESVLFEQREDLVSGPPFCHLHAGGNLYPDISLEQCKLLMLQSIEMARLFPQTIDQRPTLISIPKGEKFESQKVESRLKILAQYYKELVEQDSANEVLGSPEEYYTVYREEELLALAQNPNVKRPTTHDQWISNAIKLIDYKKLKSPLFIVQEYGWNLFRLAAQAQLALDKSPNCTLMTNTQVIDIKDVSDLTLGYNWQVITKDKVYKANYLVNASGFNSSKLDSSLQLKAERMIEFKAAYIAKWQAIPGLIPELIFHGERGTPRGMVQVTPYCDNYYQIHGMTKEITLFQDGLVQSKANEVCPEFNDSIKKKLNRTWEKAEVVSRTESAIEFASQFVPSFNSATVGGPPLYGAQQIPGDNLTLRVGDVSFPYKFYARSEIVKASSALTAANNIIKNIQQHKVIASFELSSNENTLLESITKQEIDTFAQALATKRSYPQAMSRLLIDR
ncbi:MAG: FAD-dependent oxidoreductase [Bacteroidales bacterium]|nr:FAD-dependent oxidoreductase [Bacteroidales bacterium]